MEKVVIAVAACTGDDIDADGSHVRCELGDIYWNEEIRPSSGTKMLSSNRCQEPGETLPPTAAVEAIHRVPWLEGEELLYCRAVLFCWPGDLVHFVTDAEVVKCRESGVCE